MCPVPLGKFVALSLHVPPSCGGNISNRIMEPFFPPQRAVVAPREPPDSWATAPLLRTPRNAPVRALLIIKTAWNSFSRRWDRNEGPRGPHWRWNCSYLYLSHFTYTHTSCRNAYYTPPPIRLQIPGSYQNSNSYPLPKVGFSYVDNVQQNVLSKRVYQPYDDKFPASKFPG